MDSKTGRGSFVVLWGSAAAWMAGAPVTPRDVDIVRGAFGGAALPSLADVEALIPAALRGLPLDVKTCSSEHGATYFCGEAVWSPRQDGPPSLTLPHVEGQTPHAVVLLVTEDAGRLVVSWREVTPEVSLSAAIRAGGIAGTVEALVSAVARWASNGQGRQIHPAWGMASRFEAEPGDAAGYTGQGLDALANARRHVSDDVWQMAVDTDAIVALADRLLRQPIDTGALELLREGSGGGVPRDGSGRCSPSVWISACGTAIHTRDGYRGTVADLWRPEWAAEVRAAHRDARIAGLVTQVRRAGGGIPSRAELVDLGHEDVADEVLRRLAV